MKVQRWAASIAAATVLVGGGMTVAAVGLPNLVGAQEGPTTTLEEPGAIPSMPGMGWSSMEDPLDSALEGLVADGTLTQDQADSVADAYEAEVMATVDEVTAQVEALKDDVLTTLAEAVGSTPDEVADALSSGSSIAALAEAEGIDRQAVVDELAAALSAHIDEAAASGDLPAPVVAMAKGHLAELVDQVVDVEVPLAALQALEGGGDLSGLMGGMSGGR